MANNKDSLKNTLVVAFLVCLVCAVFVSVAAVSLRPVQILNKQLDVKKNILAAAGLLDESRSVEEQFSVITTKLVDLRTGKFSTDITGTDLDIYDQFKSAKDPAQSMKLDVSDDIASIKRMENYSKVYTVENNGEIETIILPVRGYGLWSTLYGFVALESDLNTVVGFGFYDHGETPGLGGEVDNPKWKAIWPGKKIFDQNGDIQVTIKKGQVNSALKMEVDHYIDGLSGATLTSRGVHNLVRFWMGSNGFGSFLTNLKAGEA